MYTNDSDLFNNQTRNGSRGQPYCNMVLLTTPSVALICTIVSFLLIVLGAAGNIVSFLVLRYSSKNSSSNFYLRALAIADTLTLLLGFPGMIFAMFVRRLTGENVWLMSRVILKNPFCPIRLFATFFTRSISVFIIVWFTVERCAIVYRPTLSQSSWFTLKRAKIYVACIVVFSFVSTFPTFFSFDEMTVMGKTFCKVNKLFFVYTTYNLTMLSGIPSCIIILCNIMIVAAMKRRREDAKHGTTIEEHEIKRRQHLKVTKRLLIVSSGFVVFCLPLMIVNIFYQSPAADKCSPVLANIYIICLSIYVINFSVNFAFYCLTASQFRLGVKALLCCQGSNLYNIGEYLAHNAQQAHNQQGARTPKTSLTTVKLEGIKAKY